MIVHICDWCDQRITPGQPFITETTQRNVMVSDGTMTAGDPETRHYHDGTGPDEPALSTHSAAPPCHWHHRQ